MLMTEMNRIASHLLFLATNGMDLGAVSMMLYGWRGARGGPALLRVGHRAADEPQLHPPRRCRRRPARRLARRTSSRLLDLHPAAARGVRHPHDRSAHLARARCRASGSSPPTRPSPSGSPGPILRSTGYAWDLRRDQPYLAYDELDFDVVVGTYGDAFDRYAIRLNEVRESMRLIRQIVDAHARRRLPGPGQEGHAAAAGPHRRVDGGPDPPLQALHRGLPGARGRDLRRRRIAPGRARLLHRVRRQRQALPPAGPRPELREPPDACPT